MNLPPEILLLILKQVNSSQKLISSLVCRRWHSLSEVNKISPRDFCYVTIQQGQLKLLKWYRFKNLPLDLDLCSYIADGPEETRLEIFHWAKANG